MFKRIVLFLFIYTATFYPLVAQISLDLPINKAIYQRSSSGTANIPIAGMFSYGIVSSIEARLLIAGTSYVAVNWTNIQANPTKGYFNSYLNNVSAGWYTLEVRAKKSGTVLGLTTLSRIGVGEVFLIAGQSNASGYENLSPPGATSEKIITHNNFSDVCSNNFPSNPVLSQIQSASNLSTMGVEAFYWGKLGDLITNNLNVPVAFFNSAAQGSSVDNWVTSSNNQAAIHTFTGNQICANINSNNPTGVGYPYRGLQNAMRFYASQFGVRSVLWHQGESDQYLGTSSSSYVSNLNTLISKTRTDFGSTLPWTISRASYYQSGVSSNVISAQTTVANNGTQTFIGPFTDDLGSSKRDALNVHFAGSGFNDVAQKWYNVLGSTVIPNAGAISAEIVPSLNINSNGTTVTLSLNNAYASYKWVEGDNINNTAISTSASINVSSGNIRCYTTDNNGNIQFTQKININDVKNKVVNNNTCSSSIYLSDLKPYAVSNGYGPLEFDRSNGSSNDGDGGTLTLNGITYAKGLGTHANSEISYKIVPGNFDTFSAIIGIDDETGANGSVQFEVYGDGVLLYQSAVKTGSSANEALAVNIVGVSELKLKVNDGGNGISSDHADWADAKISCGINPPTTPGNFNVANINTNCAELSWTASTDNIAVAGYQIFVNNVLKTTVPANVLNEVINDLNPGTSTISIKAIDNQGNLSAASSQTINIPNLIVSYGNGNTICSNQLNTPNVNQSGGIFKLVSGSNVVVNSTTGATFFTANGSATIRYVIFDGEPCADSVQINVSAVTKPNSTTISTTSPNYVLPNTNVTVTAAACPAGLFFWMNNTSNLTINETLTATKTYKARCYNQCYSDFSNEITLKIPLPCDQNLNLISTTDDMNNVGGIEIKSTDTINLSNIITGNSEVDFEAGNYILLTPGFKSDTGTVFSAQIDDCP